MSPRIAAKLESPILFAHRGASAHAPDNTIESFTLGLKLGANGLESDVWVSQDGQAILAHDAKIGPPLRRKAIARTNAADLPDEVPTLRSLFDTLGTDFELSIDIKDPAAIDPTIDVIRAVSHETQTNVASRTWLCHPDLELVSAWRSRWSDVRLVHSTRLGSLDGPPERHAATLFDRQIDAVNFRQPDWSGGLTTLYHRFGIYCFGWDAQLDRTATELLDMGVDAIFGNYVDRLTGARKQVYGF